jgi:ABC-type sugar transport system permease subunit
LEDLTKSSITATVKEVRRRGNFLTNSRKEAITFYIMILPFLLGFSVLTVIPIIRGIYLSFTNFTGFNYSSLKFVGLRNYMHVLTDSDAMYSFIRSLYFGLIVIPVSAILMLCVALLLSRTFKGNTVFRAIFYIPTLIPVIAAGTSFKGIFDKNNGVINSILSIFGKMPVDWLGFNFCAIVLIIMLIWKSVGGAGLLITISALKGVPAALYEAAVIEGASGWTKFTRITIPMISPAIFFNLTMSIIGMMQLFVEPVTLTWNGTLLSVPFRPNYVYMVHIYQQIFVGQRFGYGLAMLWLVVLFILVMTVVFFATGRLWVHYEVDQHGGKKDG